MPRSHNAPLTSFDPRLLEIWRRIAQSEDLITVSFRTKALATKFRQELNKLRVALRACDHNLVPYINPAKIRIREPLAPDGLWDVEISQTDHEYDEALAAAGISLPKADLLELKPDIEIPDPEGDYERFMEEWCFGNKPGAVLKSITPPSRPLAPKKKEEEPQ